MMRRKLPRELRRVAEPDEWRHFGCAGADGSRKNGRNSLNFVGIL